MGPATEANRDWSSIRTHIQNAGDQLFPCELVQSNLHLNTDLRDRWDSSDPDRAPPPLPLNPTASNSPITKPNVSSNIEKAAALIASRALDSAPSAYTSNPPPSLPDKGMIRPHHRRMQSVQAGVSPSRISDSLERRSPDKGFRNSRLMEWEDFIASRTPEQSPTRGGSETPTPSGKLNKQRSDENTPPPSTMLALQALRNRQENEAPLSDVTNSASTAQQQQQHHHHQQQPLQTTPSFDILSGQILNITNIATSLQREMSSLTKRSKDNASDLSRLQEATTLRDEDIRKTLRELVAGLDQKFGNIDSRLLGAPEAARSTPNLPLYLEEKEHATPARKSFTLPRIASPASFLEREITSSPSVVSVDGAASIAMLEKVLREMATKEGQEKLMTTMEKVKSEAGVVQSVAPNVKPAIDPSIIQKLEEILVFMKDMKTDSGSKALVRAPSTTDSTRTVSQMDLYLDSEHKAGKGTSAEQVNEEVVKTLKGVKQSLSQHGGLTNEIKTLVRELRGEVLGMGREIARKLEQTASNARELQESNAPAQEDVVHVVEQGLTELKEHMHSIVKNNDLQLAKIQPPVDTNAVIVAVTQALAQYQPREPPRDSAAEREELLAAIKEAWEDCKPEIALEHFGLERDEILDTLKEGFRSYQPQNPAPLDPGATYEQVIEAVQKGLADFQPPRIEPAPSITKEEVSAAIQECLGNFEFRLPAAPPADNGATDTTRELVLSAIEEGMTKHAPALSEHDDLSKDDILDAVREALDRHAPNMNKEIEFNREDLFDAIKACLEGEQNPLGGMGERVVEAMHEFLGSMKTEFQQYSAANGRDTEQVLDALKDGLEDLRGEIESYVDRASDVTGKDEIIDAVKAGFAAMQIDMDKGFSARNNQALDTPELLDAMEKEFEHLRESIRKSLSRADTTADKNEILDAIRDISEDRGSALSSNSEDIVRLVKEELEHMRTTLASTLIKSAAAPDRDEIMDAIREGFESSRSIPKNDGNESIFSNTSELLDAFQDGVDGIRADMQKLLNKSNETAITSEILDNLNAGIENIRSDIEQLKVKQDDASDAETVRGKEIMLHDENAVTVQIENLKAMITQLANKVDSIHQPAPEINVPTEMRVHPDDLGNLHAAMEQHVRRDDLESLHAAMENHIRKDDLESLHVAMENHVRKDDFESLHAAMENHVRKDDLESVHAAIREIQESINVLPREMPEITIPEITIPEIPVPEAIMPPNAACKEDVDAIETLLHNVKAKLDDMLMPDLEAVAKTSQIESLEEMIRDIRMTIDEMASKAAEIDHKEDFTMIDLSLKDMATNIESLQQKLSTSTEDDEAKLTKTDLQVLESLCLDMKSKLDEQHIPETEGLATKEDLVEVKESIKAFREQFDSDNDLTAQAFEARKIEHGGLATKIDDVKALVSEVREEFLGKLNGNEEGITDLSRVLGMHHDNMELYATATSVTELTELVTKAFDAFMEQKSAGTTEMEERDATLFSKVEENHNDLRTKLEEKFDELMTKYDDAQITNDAKLNAMEERDKEHAQTNTTVKGVVEELKGLMDTLGAAVTDTCEKMTNDSKTVFEIVDQSNNKVSEMTESNVYEHNLTREEVAKTLEATTRLEVVLQEPHPAVLTAINEVLEMVGRHYEHSQQQSESFSKAAEEIKFEMKEIPSAIPALLPALPDPAEVVDPPVQEKYDDSQLHAKLDQLMQEKYDDSEVHTKLDQLVQERYDDSEVHTKLDELMAHSAMAKEAFATMDSHHSNTLEQLAGLEKLDSIHEKVNATAIEISAMVATQTRLMTEFQQSRAEEAREAAIALEKRTAQKEHVEADIVMLTEEKNALLDSMAALRREHEELFAQTRRLTRDVAKLETALAIRQEEMREMNVRAETLERRVLEGVVNHARTIRLAKGIPKKKISAEERDASMNLKRVVSTASQGTARVPAKAPNQLGHAVGMALKKRAPLGNAQNPRGASKHTADRRILSTSHVQNSGSKGTPRAVILAPSNNTGLVNLKRSQSVKSNPSTRHGGRRPSWTGMDSTIADKENHSSLDDESFDDGSSDAGTERRTSLGTSYMYTDSSLSRNSRRSVSYASSMGGTANDHGQDSILEEDEEHDDESIPETENSRAVVLAQSNRMPEDESDMEDFEDTDTIGDLPSNSDIGHHGSKYSAPSDSGIGSEPPTPDQSTRGWQSTVST